MSFRKTIQTYRVNAVLTLASLAGSGLIFYAAVVG